LGVGFHYEEMDVLGGSIDNRVKGKTIFTPEHAKVEMKVSPVLELEWFTSKFGQVEIDCERMTIELVEMVWALTAEEAC
jgi:predicted class III extradiol MEMO1 family dioxygenase